MLSLVREHVESLVVENDIVLDDVDAFPPCQPILNLLAAAFVIALPRCSKELIPAVVAETIPESVLDGFPPPESPARGEDDTSR